MKKSLNQKFNQIKKEISKSKKILILAHRAPDGDAIGSMLALNFYLKKQNKKTCVFSRQIPSFLNFLPGYNRIKTKRLKNSDFDLIFALDYASEERMEIPCDFEIPQEKVITIDHHLLSSGKKIGKIKVIDSKASSTCEIIYFFFKFLKIKIDRDLATILLSGILTDTVGFSRTNQKHRKVEKIIADLILSGARLFRMVAAYQYLDFNRGKILAKLLQRAEVDKELNLIHSYISLSDIKNKKINLAELPVFPDFLSRMGEVDISLFLVEQKKEKIKGSLRYSINAEIKSSFKKINLSKLAGKFGGGGHKAASGFKTKGTINSVLKKVKNEIRKELKKKK